MKKHLILILLIITTVKAYSQLETEVFFTYLKPTYSHKISTSFFSDKSPYFQNESGSLNINSKLKELNFSAGLLFKFPFGVNFEIRTDLINIDGNLRSSFDTISLSGETKSYFEENNLNKFKLMPISFNIYLKILKLWRFSSYISGGASIFTGKFKAKSKAFMTLSDHQNNVTNTELLQTDLWNFNIKTDSSISGLGGNIGGGIEIKITKRILINIEARYFKGPDKSIDWEIERKQYYSEIEQLIINDNILNNATDLIKIRYPIIIKTDFYYYGAGIKIIL